MVLPVSIDTWDRHAVEATDKQPLTYGLLRGMGLLVQLVGVSARGLAPIGEELLDEFTIFVIATSLRQTIASDPGDGKRRQSPQISVVVDYRLLGDDDRCEQQRKKTG